MDSLLQSHSEPGSMTDMLDEPVKPLRVVHVTACDDGGAALYVRNLAAGMRDLGMQVTVAGPQGKRLAECIGKLDGVEFMGFRLTPKTVCPTDMLLFLKQWRESCLGRYDIVHSHSVIGGMFAACVRSIERKAQFVYTPHCTVIHDYAGTFRGSVLSALERTAARRHDLLIAVCNAEMQEVLSCGMARKGHVAVARPSVNIHAAERRAPCHQALSRRDRHLLFGVLARLDRQKGIEFVIRSISRVKAAIPNVRCIIGGYGPLEEQLRALAHAEGVADDIDMIGPVADCGSFLPYLDAFVLPSLWEGLPHTILEAALAGTPVVAASVGGVPEAVDDSTGWLVPPARVDLLSEAIVDCLRRRDEARARAARLREWVVQYGDLDNMVQETLRSYRGVLRSG